MCGIAGVLSLDGEETTVETLIKMAALLHHRGPEVVGIYRQHPMAIAHARLSIIDLAGGLQPLFNEDKSIALICNGEIFNHVELREWLVARGHTFRTGSDCEAIIHLYEERGLDGITEMNGQWAFALWDNRARRLVLSRSRMGVRPLFYTLAGGKLSFASEIKALLACPKVERKPSKETLNQVFTYWSPLPGRTMFEGITEVPPGHTLSIYEGETNPVVQPYWDVTFPEASESYAANKSLTETDQTKFAAGLRELLEDAVKLRLLRADVPVGTYLSGGLDSSIITALAQRYATGALETFSVSFTDNQFDERHYQELVSKHLGTAHHIVECTQGDIGKALPEVIWHTEVPLTRTAPVPLFLLSGLVNQHRMKVVLTGEGADEILGGYDTFREAMIRRFWARQPESKYRPQLLSRVHGYVKGLNTAGLNAMQVGFYKRGLTNTEDPYYSHRLRWNNTSKVKNLFSADFQAALKGYDAAMEQELSHWITPNLSRYHPLSQAQYIEIKTFLSTYLLSSQGDRMGMAHSVEGRFPFLDSRVVEYCNALPPSLKLHGLTEKYLLRKIAHDLLPEEILQRTKQPFRAPIRAVFSSPEATDYVQELLDPRQLTATGVFDPAAVARLWNKSQRELMPLGEVDQMALVGVISYQLWQRQFCETFDTHLQQALARPMEVVYLHD
ncbi:MAG: asparagine synthase (glutamine-hydrolyzing) [Chloroflexota bacterium]